jgi:hypothetical protein
MRTSGFIRCCVLGTVRQESILNICAYIYIYIYIYTHTHIQTSTCTGIHLLERVGLDPVQRIFTYHTRNGHNMYMCPSYVAASWAKASEPAGYSACKHMHTHEHVRTCTHTERDTHMYAHTHTHTHHASWEYFQNSCDNLCTICTHKCHIYIHTYHIQIGTAVHIYNAYLHRYLVYIASWQCLPVFSKLGKEITVIVRVSAIVHDQPVLLSKPETHFPVIYSLILVCAIPCCHHLISWGHYTCEYVCIFIHVCMYIYIHIYM